MKGFRKAWLPWTSADQFETEEAFVQWLARRLKIFGDLRMLVLVAATGLLIVGYVIDMRPVMLLSVLPLALVLLLTLMISKTEAACGKTNQTTQS